MNPKLFEPGSHALFGAEKNEFDRQEVGGIREDDIRRCVRDWLLGERAKQWLRTDEQAS